MIRSTFDSIKFDELYLDRPTRSIRPPQADRTCKDRVWDKRRTFHESNLIHKLKICMIMYILASISKYLFALAFGSTFRSMLSSTFDPTILINLDRPKLPFSSSHVKFDV